MMYVNWIKLLNYWQGSLLRHALSLSFIIGAIKEFSNNELTEAANTKKIIHKLIDEIRSHQANGYYHHIYRCPDIGVLVVTKVNGTFAPPYSIPIENTKTGVPPSLYVSNGIKKGTNSPIDELVESILNESSEAIEAGNYSRNGKLFSAFSEYDKNAIKKALA